MGKLVDYTGQHVGRWTITGRAPSDGRQQTRWFATCSCGTRAIVMAAHLGRGATASCGCLRREALSARKTKAMIGRRFGRWLVIAPGGRRSPTDRRARWVCRCDCGMVRTVSGESLRLGSSRSCGCLSQELAADRIAKWGRGAQHPSWRGGRVTNHSGYVQVTLESTDPLFPYGIAPMPGSSTRRMLEHRYVMAQMLGRPLRSTENVHHLNGIRSDNRPENLELWTSVQPSRQRQSDLAAAGLIATEPSTEG